MWRAPAVEEVLETSAEQVVATLSGVHPESVEFFTPTAQKLIDERGTSALAAAIAQLSGFSRPPSSRSLISYEQVQGAVFDLPEEIAKELLNKQIPPGNTISKITKLPALQDDGPAFSNRDRGMRRGGPRDRRSYSTSRGRGGGQYSDGDNERGGGGCGGGRGGGNSWSQTSRNSGSDWLISDRRSSRSPSYGNNDRYNVAVKYATITPGTVFRESIICKNIHRIVPGNINGFQVYIEGYKV